MIIRTCAWLALGWLAAMAVEGGWFGTLAGMATQRENGKAELSLCVPARAAQDYPLPKNTVQAVQLAMVSGEPASPGLDALAADTWAEEMDRDTILSSRTHARDMLIGLQDEGFKAAQALLQSDDRMTRLLAVNVARETGGEEACEDLFARLSDTDEKVRFHAVVALHKICGVNFGFRHDAPLKERDEAAQRWRAYLERRGLLP